jgi:hypothetical protein
LRIKSPFPHAGEITHLAKPKEHPYSERKFCDGCRGVLLNSPFFGRRIEKDGKAKELGFSGTGNKREREPCNDPSFFFT